MLAFISVEPSSLATKLYAVQELIAALVLVAILVAIITAFLAIAVLLQEAGRSGIRWGKRWMLTHALAPGYDMEPPGPETAGGSHDFCRGGSG